MYTYHIQKLTKNVSKNQKAKTEKLLEENTGENLYNIEFGNNFTNLIKKTLLIK